MGTSVFNVLIVPVLSAMLASWIAGAAILGLVKAVEALAILLVRRFRVFKGGPQAARERRRQVRRPSIHRVGSIG